MRDQPPPTQELLRTLSFCVRLLIPRQLAAWWGVHLPNARRTLQRLAGEGWLVRRQIRARAIPSIDGPLFRWSPGDGLPLYAKLAYQATKRFENQPPVCAPAYMATRKTLDHFGLSSRRPYHAHQQTHDLGLTETYLHFRLRWPVLTRTCWIGEDLLRSQRAHREKLEDALLVHPKTNAPMLVIEYAGRYPPERFEALHQDIAARGLPYDLY